MSNATKAPLVRKPSIRTPTYGLTADGTISAFRAPFDGTITGVTYAADAAVTGAATDTRTLAVKNTGQAGVGTLATATLALVNTVNLVAFKEKAITLSGTAANVAVTEGDIIEWLSTHGGSTGLADPGGLLTIEFTRS